MIDFVTWPPNMLQYRMSFKELQIFDKVINFLASADIKPFDCACLFAMLLLIGPALFYTPGVFVYYYYTSNTTKITTMAHTHQYLISFL